MRLSSSFRSHKVHRIGRHKWHLCIGRALFHVPYKRQPFFARMPVDEKHIAWPHLRRGQQRRNAVFSTFSSNPVVALSLGWTNPIPPCINSVISPPPRFDVRKITVCDKSTLRLSPNVSVALSSIPSNSCHNASLAFSISSNS